MPIEFVRRQAWQLVIEHKKCIVIFFDKRDQIERERKERMSFFFLNGLYIPDKDWYYTLLFMVDKCQYILSGMK